MKRFLDILAAVLAFLIFAPVIAIIIVLILLRDGRPVFYVAERMKTPSQPFNLIKFRTMSNAPATSNAGVTGGDKDDRITPIGRKLRKYRLDELPQLYNIVKGDMSVVGPRPPLRQYTEAFPEIYEKVLRSRPGITGLATLHFHKREEQLISAATTPEETEEIYTKRCIPRKATLDLIYHKHESVCFDVVILWQTLAQVLGRKG